MDVTLEPEAVRDRMSLVMLAEGTAKAKLVVTRGTLICKDHYFKMEKGGDVRLCVCAACGVFFEPRTKLGRGSKSE